MDKLIETPWFVKVVALLLAALLYISVNFEPNNQAGSFNTPSQKDKVIVDSVPVEVYYDRDNLVVTGVPKTVDVTLYGPKNLILPAKSSREFKVYLDLSDPEIQLGKRKVALKVRDLNDKIKATITPDYVDISIQEKVTKEFSVEPEFNRTLLDNGYIVDKSKLKIKPEHVKITGAKDVIEQIAYVKAVINLDDGVKDTVNVKAKVRALDKNLNKLDVSIDPGYINVEVPIEIPSKEMSVLPVESGKPKDGITIGKLKADPSRVTLYGKQSILDAMDQLQIPVDISKIDESTTIEVPIDLPEGVSASSVQKVKVTIEAKQASATEDNENNKDEETTPDDKPTNTDPPATDDKQQDITKTFQNVKIRYNGLGEDMDLAFLSPGQGMTSITVTGPQNDINNLKSTDLQAFINVAELLEGEHSVPVSVKLPNSLKGQAGDSSAKVSITKKNVETSGSNSKDPSET
ncbi:YbbR-like domain-containing protein [Bacillus sp. 1P06AnD]|uniref:CdaR family protein n=1 Tax=Bacillus sp. 1P06AnD TaxID=3132208 RepID=UPI0039A07274